MRVSRKGAITTHLTRTPAAAHIKHIHINTNYTEHTHIYKRTDHLLVGIFFSPARARWVTIITLQSLPHNQRTVRIKCLVWIGITGHERRNKAVYRANWRHVYSWSKQCVCVCVCQRRVENEHKIKSPHSPSEHISTSSTRRQGPTVSQYSRRKTQKSDRNSGEINVGQTVPRYMCGRHSVWMDMRSSSVTRHNTWVSSNVEIFSEEPFLLINNFHQRVSYSAFNWMCVCVFVPTTLSCIPSVFLCFLKCFFPSWISSYYFLLTEK